MEREKIVDGLAIILINKGVELHEAYRIAEEQVRWLEDNNILSSPDVQSIPQ